MASTQCKQKWNSEAAVLSLQSNHWSFWGWWGKHCLEDKKSGFHLNLHQYFCACWLGHLIPFNITWTQRYRWLYHPSNTFWLPHSCLFTPSSLQIYLTALLCDRGSRPVERFLIRISIPSAKTGHCLLLRWSEEVIWRISCENICLYGEVFNSYVLKLPIDLYSPVKPWKDQSLRLSW